VATILDVAREAGVGVGTVSRVINGRERVAPGTRARVLDVIDRLDYSPNQSARSLSMGRTDAVCVLVPFLTSASVNARLQGVVEALASSGREVTLRVADTAEQRDRAIAAIVGGSKPAGLMVISLPLSEVTIAELRSAQVSTVAIDVALHGVPSVTVDDVAGGKLATQYLLDRGHRAIGFIGDDDDEQGLGFRSSTDRRLGYLQAMADFGLGVQPEYIKSGPFGREVAHRLTRELLSLEDRPTAIFAASDTQAFGVLESVAAHGLAVPEDVSVIGFDDVELAPYVGLTSVRQPLFESGKLGAAALLSLLDGADVDDVPLSLTVVERSTVCDR
jgi:LacI family transcriptional regulator